MDSIWLERMFTRLHAAFGEHLLSEIRPNHYLPDRLLYNEYMGPIIIIFIMIFFDTVTCLLVDLV